MYYEIGSREIGKDYSSRQIVGMRDYLQDVFTRNMPKGKKEKQGYMLALYLLRNNFLPEAYCKSEDCWTMHDQINIAVNRLAQLD